MKTQINLWYICGKEKYIIIIQNLHRMIEVQQVKFRYFGVTWFKNQGKNFSKNINYTEPIRGVKFMVTPTQLLVIKNDIKCHYKIKTLKNVPRLFVETFINNLTKKISFDPRIIYHSIIKCCPRVLHKKIILFNQSVITSGDPKQTIILCNI